ncbi:MAG: HD domain-containing protein [Ruminococcaceae bacterium]|nr:HD domain-containing protein [Oscillospiraceae bacterium]
MKEITETMLASLREHVMRALSPRRAHHTLAVEEMTARLCALFCPAYVPQMRAAALLHDLTKEKSPAEQEALCVSLGLPVSASDQCSPKLFHARTAAALIPVEFPDFDDPVIVSAVRWHTTGHGGMTLTEKLLYLADYIDESRTFENCVLLRRYFFGAYPDRLSEEERLELLRRTLLMSYDMTIKDLMAEGKPIAADTVAARNELIPKLSK